MKFHKSSIYSTLSVMKNDLTEQEAQWSVTVGLVLRRRRRQANLVQEDLAYRAGMGRLTMQRIEYGQTSPNLVTLLRICSALEIAPSALFREAEQLIKHPKKLQAEIAARDAELLQKRGRTAKQPRKA